MVLYIYYSLVNETLISYPSYRGPVPVFVCDLIYFPPSNIMLAKLFNVSYNT